MQIHNTMNNFLLVKFSKLVNCFVIIIHCLLTVFIYIKIPFRTKCIIIIRYHSVICKFTVETKFAMLCLLVIKGTLQINILTYTLYVLATLFYMNYCI